MIIDVYMSIIKRYKEKMKSEDKYYEKYGRKKSLSRNDVNEYSWLFYVIFSMHKRYGCPECGRSECMCGVLPDRHDSIPASVYVEDLPWCRKAQDSERK